MPHARGAPSNHEKKKLPLPLAGEGAGEGGMCWLPPYLNPLLRMGEEVFGVIFNIRFTAEAQINTQPAQLSSLHYSTALIVRCSS